MKTVTFGDMLVVGTSFFWISVILATLITNLATCGMLEKVSVRLCKTLRFLVYDFCARFNPKLYQKLVAERLTTSEKAVEIIIRAAVEGGVIPIKHVPPLYQLFDDQELAEYFFACAKYGAIGIPDKFIADFMDFAVRIGGAREVQRRVLGGELIHINRNLIVKLDPCWKEIIVKMFLGSTCVPQVVKDKIHACGYYPAGDCNTRG